MQIIDVIASAQNGEALPNLARAFGISPLEAEAVLEAALPALVRGIERNTLSRGGLADLVKALGAGHHEQILERPDTFADPRVQQDGLGILGHLLGSESRARSLAHQTARATGISDSIVEMMLPIIAQMLMGALSRWLKGGLGDIASRLPGGSGPPLPSPQGGPRPGTGRGFELPEVERPQGGFPMPPMPGGGGFGRGGSIENAPADASERDVRLPGGFPLPLPQEGGPSGGGFPLPLPGGGGGGIPLPLPLPQDQGHGLPLPLPQSGDNPYGDLSDILRRRGTGPLGGGGLWSIVRGLLGSALGFQSKGVISWIVRAVLLRFGWQILRRLLGRAFLGR